MSEENNQDPFGENQAEGYDASSQNNQTPESSEGFGVQESQSQNLNNEGQAEEGLEGTINRSEVEKQAEDKLAREKVKNMLKKYMPGIDPDNVLEKEADLKDVMEEADHLGFRFLTVKDISEMTSEEQEKHEENIAKTIKFYDAIKKYTAGIINPYHIQLGSKLKKAKQVKGKLERNVRIFERELNGKGYKVKSSVFYQDIMDSLPSYVKDDKKFSGITDHLLQYAKNSNGEGGLKKLYRDLGEKGRVFKDIDDMIAANITQYEHEKNTSKNRIDEINEQLKTEKGNKSLIQERMEENAKYASYVREMDKWLSVQDHVVDEMLGIEAEYSLSDQQIKLRETVLDGTKETIRDLNAGVKQLENFVKTKNDTVMIGSHIMNVNYARQIAELINLGGLVAGQASVYLLKNMADTMREGMRDSISKVGAEKVNEVNDQMKAYKRERVEKFKSQLGNAFYQ